MISKRIFRQMQFGIVVCSPISEGADMKWAIATLLMVQVVSANPEEKVAEIRGWYAAIQNAKAESEVKTEFADDEEFLTGTRTVRKYAGNLTAMTVEWGAGDHGWAEEHYYFRNGELFFAYHVLSSWSFVEGGTPEKPLTEDTRREIRYYFDGVECIRALTRSASARDASTLVKKIASVEQESIEVDADARSAPARAGKLLKATTDAAICAALEAESGE